MGKLLNSGHRVVTDPLSAEAIVVNTCGFIEGAKRESIEKILEVAEYKRGGNLQKLVVTGCLAQRYKGELVENLPEVDVFVGTGEFQNIVDILGNGETTKRGYFDQKTYLDLDGQFRINSEPFYRAYLKISEGCLKRCSFCAIPHIRGSLQSRPLSKVIEEARRLISTGVQEITVISHDFTDYGWDLRRDRKGPVELLRGLSDLEGLKWIRLLYLYPDGVTSEMVDLIKERENLIPYFDLPFQHVSDRILSLMNRRTTKEELSRIVEEIRSKIPEAVLRTQFLVGFPGESEEEFEEVLHFVEKYEFDRVGGFIFSPEEGTKAAALEDRVEQEIKERRYHQLMELQQPISRKKNQMLVGKTLPVVIDGVSEESEHLLQGRLATQAPDIDGVVLINDGQAEVGTIVPVVIHEALEYDLIGAITSSH